MLDAPPIADLTLPPGPPGGRILLQRPGGAVSDRLARLLIERATLTDDALAELESDLDALAATLADRIEAMLDGAPTGSTAFESAFAGMSEGRQVAAAVLVAQLDELVDLVEDCGLGRARGQWFRAYGRLADAAERTMGALGFPDSTTLLDREAAAEQVDALRRRHDDALFGTFARQTAVRTLDALQTQVGLVTHKELADSIQGAEDLTRPQAMAEAATRIAEADRYFTAVAAEQASDDADTFLYGYAGPIDARTRPFCRKLVGKAFSVNEIKDLRNGQTSAPPFYTCGGYHCQHVWVPFLPALLEDMPYSRGSEADIAAANAAAGARGKRGGGK